ncbi:sugar transferase [Gemmata sp. G18]|uniref:Sugar transferase n=1 Tax=Gemmata palustris TaxID=2822762 RepID=A0ABS5C4K3_9BACT|nr:sugar transferase [Gemmata palustris]
MVESFDCATESPFQIQAPHPASSAVRPLAKVRATLDDRAPRANSGWTLRRAARFQRKKYGRLAGRTAGAVAKRALDVSVALALLIALAPLFAIVALLIKATDGGPVLFWQTRVGRWGREFRFPKFRSMVPNAERLLTAILDQNHHQSGVTFKLKRDPRVTWIGRLIRRASIDELPQLWCVLTGRMTLVGPRPAVVREVAQYTPTERRRLAATPGLTCIWQVSGRGDIPFGRQVEMDIEYIQKQSLLLDLKLLVLTVPAVLFGRGAY